MTTATVKFHYAHDADTELKTVALDLSDGRPAKPYALLLSHTEN